MRWRFAGWLLIVGSLLGCAREPDPGVKVVVPALPTTLDWNTSDATNWVNFPVVLATERGLTQLAPDGGLAPCLAQSWEVAAGPGGAQRYTFQLRQDVRWSDGEPLVAQDFVVGWTRARQGFGQGDLSDVVAFAARGPHVFEATLDQPHHDFLARLANLTWLYPAPSHQLAGLPPEGIRDYFDRPRDGRPLALGPFRVDRWDRVGDRLRLVRNPNSSFGPALGPGERPVQAVTLLRTEVGQSLYARGRVSFVTLDDPAALHALPADAHRQPLLSTYFLGLNTQRPPLNDLGLRRAIAMAVDRARLLAGLLPQVRLDDALLPPGLPSAPSHRPAGLPFDPDEARRLVQHLPAPVRPLRLLYSASNSFLPEAALAERLREQLAAIGVPVRLEARQDFGAELARIAPDGFYAADLYLRRIGADYADPTSFFSFFMPQGVDDTGWQSLEGGVPLRRFLARLQEGEAQRDPALAAAAYGQAQQVLLTEAVVLVPLFHPDRYFRVSPKLRGLGVDPFNFITLSGLRWAGAASP